MLQEILISTSADVLEEIRRPNVHAVSWNITAVEAFQDAISSVRKVADNLKLGSEAYRKTLTRAEVRALNLTNVERSMVPFKERLQEISGFLNYGRTFQDGIIIEPPRNLLPGGKKPKYSNAMPHIDEKSVAVFLSFNSNASGPLCIPEEFSGEPDPDEGFFFEEAEKDKAVTSPGASISIIDLGRQVHCSPDPCEDWRIMGRMIASP